uniref:Uncharacterized protein n=1 Tax=Oryza barthii TaxID=65489 RepID=A0A0D3GKC3_9ORYZ
MGAPLKLTWASLGSLFATAVLVRTAVRDFLPPEAHGLLRALLSRAVASLPDSHATLDAFRGVRVLWTSQLDGNASSSFGGSSSSSRGFVHHPFPIGGRQRCLRLEFRRRDRDVVRDAYIPFEMS